MRGELNFTPDELHQEFRVQLEKIIEAGYQRFEKRQRSAVPLELSPKFLAWLRDHDPEIERVSAPSNNKQ